jgi:hypothetical protein
MTDQQRPDHPEPSDAADEPSRETLPLPEQPDSTPPLPTESQPPQDQPPHYQAYPAEAAAAESQQPAFAPPPLGPVGKVRGTGMCILLEIITIGIYGLYWFFAVHQEMKRHSGRGIGGGIALIIAIFIGIVIPFLTSNEVGDLYSARGEERRVSGTTGLWYFPGMFILIGPIVWFVKTNRALNSYWERAAQAPPPSPSHGSH